MIEIIWLHIKACRADLRAYRLGDLTIANRKQPAGQVTIENKHRTWRLK